VAVDVTPGTRAASQIDIAREVGTLVVESNVPEAEMELVGPEPDATKREAGLATAWEAELPGGFYALKVEAPAYTVFTTRFALREAGHRVVVSLEPILCAICGTPAGSSVFDCNSCGRASLHDTHRHTSGSCTPCAARRSFESARASGSSEAWQSFLTEFEPEVDRAMVSQARGELKRIAIASRERELIERATLFASLAERGQLAEVISSWEAVAAGRSTDPDVWLALGTARERAGDHSGAADALRRGAALAVDDPFMHHCLGRVVARLDALDEAISSYGVVLRERPDLAPGHFELAGILVRAGRLEDAIASYRAAVQHRGDVPVFQAALGKALYESARFREAEEALTAASRLYRQAGDVDAATAVEKLAADAREHTALGKASKFIKGLFDR
jgi:Flp pilus assembly protein TadD